MGRVLAPEDHGRVVARLAGAFGDADRRADARPLGEDDGRAVARVAHVAEGPLDLHLVARRPLGQPRRERPLRHVLDGYLHRPLGVGRGEGVVARLLDPVDGSPDEQELSGFGVEPFRRPEFERDGPCTDFLDGVDGDLCHTSQQRGTGINLR